MAAPTASPAAEMISQLESARKLALNDPQVYSQVVPGILPLVGAPAALEVRRWGADFIAECFASPSFPNAQKELLVADVLPALRSFLENPAEDAAVVRSAIQAAASLYSLVFKRIASHPDQAPVWQTMISIKINILQRMDSSPVSIKICCIKFLQKVVQVQTPGVIVDPRRPDQNETSLAIVPRQHPLLPLPQLEAEGAGLLDRLLSVFQDPKMDPILIDATLNCLAVLIRTRPAVANKILSAILSFNPFRAAPTSMTPRLHVIYRSMERTTFALLKFIVKTMPQHGMVDKIHAYMVRLQQQRVGVLSGTTGVKRPAEQMEGLDDAKRPRLMAPQQFPPMPPPPNSVAQLFTLTEDTMLHQFDVKLLPVDIVNSVVFLLMQMMEQGRLDPAIEAVRQRYDRLKKLNQPTQVPEVPMAGPTGIDDDDDYEPDFSMPQEAAAVTNTEKALEELAQPAINLGPFELPKPPPLTEPEVAVLSDQTVRQLLGLVVGLESTATTSTRQKLGFNRLAAAANDRDAWVTIISRIAARTPASIEDYDQPDPDATADAAEGTITKIKSSNDPIAVANRIREHLSLYILDDFRPRLNIAISWLSEEWYADKLHAKGNTPPSSATELPNYTTWSVRLLNRLVHYLDARDKNLLIRFLSEIPSITKEILDSVKILSRDPERVGMCVLAMQYLLMFRPPSRVKVMNMLREMVDEGDSQVKAAAGKVLEKWKNVVAAPTVEAKNEDGAGIGAGEDGPVKAPEEVKEEVNGIGMQQQQQQFKAEAEHTADDS